jgi:signal transduction histidine kinase
MASHELKTPVTSLKLFIELLTRELMPINSKKLESYITRIKHQSDRLAELTNDLLDVSRIQTGKLQLKKEKFNLSSLIATTVEGLQWTTNDHTLLFTHDTKITVIADKFRINQVLINFISNAIKYSPRGKEILITVKKNNGEVIVSVKDFGIGIKKAQQKKIFEKLYQVTDPIEKTYPGLGLGLYISKDIIDRHNGRIWVESQLGKGSTFSFALPKA